VRLAGSCKSSCGKAVDKDLKLHIDGNRYSAMKEGFSNVRKSGT
jgi:hypothetical protein